MLAAASLLTLAACANENGAIPFDSGTWSLQTDARGNPYPATRDGTGPVPLGVSD
ncbi:hypothetical protein [uncultured Jannaschia sp.]|uniref:hypothetical protein n=1 Tax=uncultured Jannaschia sp. TaxID=293347 RepID=UPI00260FCF38|nr:hypothetical protein [uncultured Jannaschia sp.]